MAIRVVNVRRAMCLLFRELAEVVSLEEDHFYNYDFDSWVEISHLKRRFEPDQHDWIRTVRFHIAVPRIVRLLFYDRLPRNEVKLNRRNIYARDGNHCQYCGKKFSTTELSIDHVVPRRLGGKTTWENVVCSCVGCNARKGGRTPREAYMKLIRPPVQPKRNPVINIRLGSPKYACWQAFLDNAYWSVELK
jgi:5-methylcytosine-specific restriction endonuclease McrA